MPGIALRRIKSGKKTGKPLKIAGSRILVGRSSECDLRMSSDAASRKHAVVRLEGDTWYIEDLGSRNGTYLNGKKIQTSALRISDVLKFGETGAKIQIVALDPAPKRDKDGEEATRYIRVSKGDQPAEAIVEPMQVDSESRPAKKRPSPPPREEAHHAAAPKKGAPMWTWIIVLLCLAFGGLTGFEMSGEATWWEMGIKDFPHPEVQGTLRWVFDGISELDLDLSADAAKWLIRGLYILYFGLFGFFLRRPWRYRFFLLVMLIAHGIAIATLSD